MRDAKQDVAAAILFLLKKQVGRQTMEEILEQWPLVSLAQLKGLLLTTGEQQLVLPDEAQRAFTPGLGADEAHLLTEWYRWLHAMTNWVPAASQMNRYVRDPKDVIADQYDPKN